MGGDYWKGSVLTPSRREDGQVSSLALARVAPVGQTCTVTLTKW